jgi:hypothetical protein
VSFHNHFNTSDLHCIGARPVGCGVQLCDLCIRLVQSQGKVKRKAGKATKHTLATSPSEILASAAFGLPSCHAPPAPSSFPFLLRTQFFGSIPSQIGGHGPKGPFDTSSVRGCTPSHRLWCLDWVAPVNATASRSRGRARNSSIVDGVECIGIVVDVR